MSEHMCCANSTIIFKPIIIHKKKKEKRKKNTSSSMHTHKTTWVYLRRTKTTFVEVIKRDVSIKNVTDCMILEKIKYRKEIYVDDLN